MFTQGQSYVALSRCKSWGNVKILALSSDALSVNEKYIRLEQSIKKQTTYLIINKSVLLQ